MVVRIYIYKKNCEKALKIKEGDVSVLDDTQCASLKHIYKVPTLFCHWLGLTVFPIMFQCLDYNRKPPWLLDLKSNQ